MQGSAKGNTVGEGHIHIEESDQSYPSFTILVIIVNSIECVLNGSEGNDLAEEIEVGVTSRVVREVGDRRWSGPTDDTDKKDTTQDSTSNAVYHEHDCEESAEEDADPNGRTTENTSQTIVGMFRIFV